MGGSVSFKLSDQQQLSVHKKCSSGEEHFSLEKRYLEWKIVSHIITVGARRSW
jgi:hypothetical protein